MPKRYRYDHLSSATRDILRRQTEAGRFEFKQTAAAVTVRVLVAAANAAALERLSEVTILVGVAELKDPYTGAVTGQVVGLGKLEKAKELIRNYAFETLPVPVHVVQIEENMATDRPILRLLISPTRPPHYDKSGARMTRDGAGIRAIADEELVDLYLTREADSFRQRFATIAESVIDSIGDVSLDVDDLAAGIKDLKSDFDTMYEATAQLQGSTDETFAFITDLDERLGDLQSSVSSIASAAPSIEEALAQLTSARNSALFRLYVARDLLQHLGDRIGTARSEPRFQILDHATEIESLSQSAPELLAYRRNLREAGLWSSLASLQDQKSPSPDEWTEAIQAIRRCQGEPAA